MHGLQYAPAIQIDIRICYIGLAAEAIKAYYSL
jgi:hypothetical protein